MTVQSMRPELSEKDIIRLMKGESSEERATVAHRLCRRIATDVLTDDERAAFTQMNTAYTEKFGFPFIIAVRDHDKPGILAAFERRLQNDRATEFAEACKQVERIAELRLIEKLG